MKMAPTWPFGKHCRYRLTSIHGVCTSSSSAVHMGQLLALIHASAFVRHPVRLLLVRTVSLLPSNGCFHFVGVSVSSLAGAYLLPSHGRLSILENH